MVRQSALVLGSWGAKAVFVDPETLDLRFEGRTCYAQSGRRSRWSVNDSTACPQGLLDHALLVSRDGAGQCETPPDRRSGGKPALVDGEFVGVAHNHRPLNHVLQLAHIAWPRIRAEAIEGPVVDAPD